MSTASGAPQATLVLNRKVRLKAAPDKHLSNLRNASVVIQLHFMATSAIHGSVIYYFSRDSRHAHQNGLQDLVLATGQTFCFTEV